MLRYTKFIAAAALLLSSAPTFADTPSREQVIFDMADTICPAPFELSAAADGGVDMTKIVHTYAHNRGLTLAEEVQVMRYCLMWLHGNDHGLTALQRTIP